MAQIVYARVNQILEDEITVLTPDASRTPITGLTFTLLLSRGTTTGLSTAGISVTEIGSGKYDVSINAATLATTGVYTFRASATSGGINYLYEAIYVITSDGTPSGTTGTASFTATSGNGRVTDGTSALAGATVYINDPSGNLYTTTTTSATGVWGPIYFTTNGAYPVYTQKSLYAQGSATITVSGASATLSPATDISMATISTGTGLLASDLIAYARRMSFDRTGTKADTELLQSANMALDMIAKARLWPRYVTRGQITFNGVVSTGTVTTAVNSANVTLIGATWPSWAAGAKLLIGGQVYAISSVTSSTVAVLEATWVDPTIVGPHTYQLFQDSYALPNNMYKFGRLVPGQRWPYGGDPVGPQELIEQQMLIPFSLRGPFTWTFINQSIVVYPFPSQDILTGYWYYRRPPQLVSNTDQADWDPAHIELLRRAIDYQVAVLYGSYTGGTPEQAMQRYTEALSRAAPNDRSAVTQVGMMTPPLTGANTPIWLRRTT